MIDERARGDAGAFLTRLVRLDPAALVRLRPIRPGLAQLWAMLPFRVLVVRTLVSTASADATVGAGGLLATLTDPAAPTPARQDAAWRWALPPSRGRLVERLPVTEVARLATAASQTLRAAVEHGVGGRAAGERVVRDALLGHVAVVVHGPAGERVEVPQRLIQGVARMGFIKHSTPTMDSDCDTKSNQSITVRVAGQWIGLAAPYGSAWYQPSSPLRLT